MRTISCCQWRLNAWRQPLRPAGSGLAFGSTLWWFWAPEFAAKRDYVQPFLEFADQVVPPPRFLSAMVRTEDVHPANCSTMLRCSVLRTVGGFDEQFPGMYEDTVMLANMLLVSDACVMGEVLSVYRMHPDSQCHTALASGDYHLSAPNRDRERYLRWLDRTIRARRTRNPRLSWTLRRELWLYDHPRLHGVIEGSAGRRLIDLAKRLLGRRTEPQGVPGGGEAADLGIPTLQALEAFYFRHGRPADAAVVRARWEARAAGE